MSDWGAQHTTVASALGGLDMAMPGDGARNAYGGFWGGALTEAVLNGTVPQWRLDDMVVRIMAAYYKVNINKFRTRPEINFSAWTRPNTTVGPLHFTSNTSFAEVNKHVNVQADHAVIIREMAAKSVVLLKNTGSALPLKAPKSIAVIGEDAQDPPGGPNACDDNRCYRGTLSMGYGSGTANYPYLVSPVTALKAQADADSTVFTNTKSNWDLAAAQEAAASASVAVVFASATAGENFITIGGNAGDRNNLTLWNGGDELIRAVAAVNPNTVVVLHTVGPVLLDYARDHPNITAILWAGLPGQESGNALADVLYGRVNPQGRSPFTWARHATDYPVEITTRATTVPPSQNFSEGVFIDYRHFQQANITPIWEFGYGLSYTQFRYSDLSVKVAPATYKPAGGLTPPAPTYGTIDRNETYTIPEGFRKIRPYVYPWVTAPVPAAPTPPAVVPATNGSAQPVLPASGGPGGNVGLYDVVDTINFTVESVDKVAGTDSSAFNARGCSHCSSPSGRCPGRFRPAWDRQSSRSPARCLGRQTLRGPTRPPRY